MEGRDFWVQQLLRGKRLSPIGANDAHGDLNRNIGVKTPLFSLYQNRKHVFGNVRTVVRSEHRTIAGIKAGLASGRLFCTDGPFLNLSREQEGLRLDGATSEDFGSLRTISVLAGKKGDTREFPVREWKWEKNGPSGFSEILDIPAGATYVRAEANTHGNRFALGAPVFT